MSRYLVWSIAALALAIAFFVLEPFFVSQTARPGGPEGLVGESAPVFALRDDRGSPRLARAVSRTRRADELVGLVVPAVPRGDAGPSTAGKCLCAQWNRNRRRQRRRVAPARCVPSRIRWAFAFRSGSTPVSGTDARTPRSGLPTTVIIDRRGVVVRAFDGALTFAQMESAVTPAGADALSGLRAAALAVAAAVVVEIALPGPSGLSRRMVQRRARRTRRCRDRRRPAAFRSERPRVRARLAILAVVAGAAVAGLAGVASGLFAPDNQTIVGAPGQRISVEALGVLVFPFASTETLRKRLGDVASVRLHAPMADRRAPARRRQFHSANGTAKRRLRRGTRSARESADDHAAGRLGVSFAGALDGASANDRRNGLALRFVHRSGRRTRRQGGHVYSRAGCDVAARRRGNRRAGRSLRR